jgi:hypothetical protein
MSVTVKKILELPSLRGAKVLGGKQSLDRIVNSISVLEYAKPTPMQEHLFTEIQPFLGAELVITGFCSIPDDVEAQCANIRRLSEAGEVGLILYYVGLVMPKVDRRLIKLSDELGFVLICMPENDPGLRYSEVICEVMDKIVRDELDNPAFAFDLLDQISRLPKHQQTIETMLYLVSDRLRASVAVVGADGGILNVSPWPHNTSPDWEEYIKTAPASDGEACREFGGGFMWVYRGELRFEYRRDFTLLAFSDGKRIAATLWKQTVEGVRLAINLWGQDRDKVGLLELARAIIQDEPIKMRRLGEIFNLDVSALSDMWLLRSLDSGGLGKWTDEIRELSQQYAAVGICEQYGEDIVIFPIGAGSLQDRDEWAAAVTGFCEDHGARAVLEICTGLRQTKNVKRAYRTCVECIGDAMAIFPGRSYYTLPELEFAKTCRQIADGGADCIEEYSLPLDAISCSRDGADIIDTLSVCLLDKNSNVTATSEALFVHKNTIKYRLRKAGDILGYHIGDMPDSQSLLYALAIRRLLG